MSKLKEYITEENSSKITDGIYEYLRKNSVKFKNLSMDEQGELIIKIGKILKGKI